MNGNGFKRLFLRTDIYFSMEYNYDKSLGNISRMISKALGKRLEEKLETRNINITAEQWSVISLLFQKEMLTQVEIGAYLGLDKVRVLRIVRNLEDQKNIKRVISKADKRYNDVCLSDEGKQLYQKIVPIASDVHKEAFNNFKPEDINLCLSLLDKINNNLK